MGHTSIGNRSHELSLLAVQNRPVSTGTSSRGHRKPKLDRLGFFYLPAASLYRYRTIATRGDCAPLCQATHRNERRLLKTTPQPSISFKLSSPTGTRPIATSTSFVSQMASPTRFSRLLTAVRASLRSRSTNTLSC